MLRYLTQLLLPMPTTESTFVCPECHTCWRFTTTGTADKQATFDVCIACESQPPQPLKTDTIKR
jgi:hypothetical protein